VPMKVFVANVNSQRRWKIPSRSLNLTKELSFATRSSNVSWMRRILSRLICAYTPKQNGITKNDNHMILESTKK